MMGMHGRVDVRREGEHDLVGGERPACRPTSRRPRGPLPTQLPPPAPLTAETTQGTKPALAQEARGVATANRQTANAGSSRGVAETRDNIPEQVAQNLTMGRKGALLLWAHAEV